MDLAAVLSLYGGMASWTQLRQHLSTRQIEAAIQAGEIKRVRRGVYAMSRVLYAREIAQSMKGVLSHHSAAEYLQMGTFVTDDVTHITVPANRSRVQAPAGVRVHYANLTPDEIAHDATTPARTAIDCARTFRFTLALTIVEAATRTQHISLDDLIIAAEHLRGPGSVRAREVIDAADTRSQSVMESLLRGLLLEAGITCFQPQLPVKLQDGTIWHADLGDPTTRTLLEADSFTWHGTRQALADDCSRYNEFVALGYAVLRFAYEHLLYSPRWTVDVVRRSIAHR